MSQISKEEPISKNAGGALQYGPFAKKYEFNSFGYLTGSGDEKVFSSFSSYFQVKG